MRKSNLFFAALALLPVACTSTTGEPTVTLPTFMTDSMVVQRLSTLKIKGHAKGDVKVKASWDNKTYESALADDSTFIVEIPTPEAGGPYTITLSDGKGADKVLRDVYSGIVWLCSGQSNMAMPVGGWGKVLNYEAELDSASDYPLIRLLQINRHIAVTPQDNEVVNMGGWRPASPSTVYDFSAIAYFFARNLQRELGGIPVGVIDCSWNGTPAEAWTSLAGVSEVGGFGQDLETIRFAVADSAALMEKYRTLKDEWGKKAKEDSAKMDYCRYHKEWPVVKCPALWDIPGLADFDGVVYMQRTVDIPEAVAGKELELKLAKIDDNDDTYFNGVKIGHTSGYATDRSYIVPDTLVNAGEAVITVVVHDNGGGGGIYGEPDSLIVRSGNWNVSLCGDWAYNRTLEPCPAAPLHQNIPTLLYNAMLNPLRDIHLDGVLWYQGCSNVGRGEQYSRLFKRLIGDWRALFGRDDLPFYFVQLAAYLKPEEIQPNSSWAALRQAQADALALENTAMVSAIDIGDAGDIHPKNKQEVARRLSLAALKNVYGCTDVIAEAPKVSDYKFDGSKATLTFSAPVTVDGDAPKGFIAKTTSGKWMIPQIALVSDTLIILTAPSDIVEVKYNWADFPNGNLRGSTTLPILPFTIR